MTWRNILCPACHTKSATPFHVPIWQLQFELGLLMMSFAQNYTNYMGSLQCWSWNHNTAAAYFFWSAKSRPVKLRCLRNSLDKGRPKSGKMDPRKLAWVDTEASESEIGRRWKKQRMWGLKMCFLPTWAAGADATVKRPALIHIRRPWSQQGIYPGNLVHNVSHMLQKIKSNTLISDVNYDVEKQRQRSKKRLMFNTQLNWRNFNIPPDRKPRVAALTFVKNLFDTKCIKREFRHTSIFFWFFSWQFHGVFFLMISCCGNDNR